MNASAWITQHVSNSWRMLPLYTNKQTLSKADRLGREVPGGDSTRIIRVFVKPDYIRNLRSGLN